MAQLLKTALWVLGLLGVGSVAWAFYMYFAHIRYQGTVEDAVFVSGDGVTMRGWFIKPHSRGPHPAVVFLHGSGPLSGDHPIVRVFANAFLRSGISVLTYDKRGVGSSGGTFNHNDYDAFIEDAVNAVAYLQSRDDVASHAIGLVGSSEGGWFAPEIAATTGSISFIVNRAGPPLTWIETNLWEKRHRLLDSGLSADVVDEAVALRGRILRFLVDVNAGRAEIDSQIGEEIDADIKAFNATHGDDELWLQQTSVRFGSLTETAAFWSRWERAIGYDPRPFIEQVDIPMLYVFAEEDKNVPTAASIHYLTELDADNIEIQVIEGVAHSMLSPAALIYGSHPEFVNVVGPWAASKIRPPPADSIAED